MKKELSGTYIRPSISDQLGRQELQEGIWAGWLGWALSYMLWLFTTQPSTTEAAATAF